MGVMHGNNFTSESSTAKIVFNETLLNKKTTCRRRLRPEAKKKKKNENYRCTEGKKIGRSFPLAEYLKSILNPRMLFFYLVAKTAHIPRIGPEVLFFRHLWL